MRNGQNKRMRGRNNNHHHRKNQNPMTRVYESNGPDVKIRGTPSHIAEKYMQLARDAQSSGDPIAAENYYQHAEHYYRLIAAAQEQFRQNNPQAPFRPDGEPIGARDDVFDDEGDDMNGQPMMANGDQPFGTREPQPYLPPNAQPFAPRDQQVRAPQATAEADDVDRLPSFITGGQPQAPAPAQANFAQNGHDNQADRFPLHRRRRRHRGGPRQDAPAGGPQGDE
jgi:uncharacterized protein DUF4167